MLTPAQRRALTSVVARRLPNNPTIAIVEPFFVDPEIALDLPGGTLLQVAEWIIDQALAQATPAMFVQLVDRVDDNQPRMASLVDLAEALRSDPGAWRSSATQEALDWSLDGDPLHVLDGRPFVDRASFRRLIPRLGSVETPSCTVVKGDNGHGKSYLHEYCKKLAGHWASAQPNMLRVGISECPSAAVSTMLTQIPAIELSSGLGLDSSRAPRQHEDPHRYARNLAAWIVSQAPAGPLPAIAILDGYGDPGVPKPVRTFIEELIRAIQSDEAAAKRLRVILLDYDIGRLEDLELEFEVSVLEHVGDEEIVGWFRKRFPGQPAFRYEDAVDTIRPQIPTDGPLRMRTLCALMRAMSAGFEAA